MSISARGVLALAALATLAAESAAIHRASVDLTEDNFNDKIAGKTSLVKFYAPWCGHCKRLAPTWDELADAFANSNTVMIAGVDCTTEQNRGLCMRNGIRGYPTLRAFTPDRPFGIDYQGNRDLEALKAWANDISLTEELGVGLVDLHKARREEQINAAAAGSVGGDGDGKTGGGHDNNGELPADAGDWDWEQVVSWAKDKGLSDAVQAKLAAHKIDGDILLHIEGHDLEDDLEMTDQAERDTMWRLLTALKAHNIPMGIEGLSFWQQRALNRRAMDSMVLAIGFAPRTAMSYFKLFPSHAQPADRVLCGEATCSLGWPMWVLVPEYYLWGQSDTLMGGLPGLVPASLVLTMLLKAVVLVLVIATVAGANTGFTMGGDVGGGGSGGLAGLPVRRSASSTSNPPTPGVGGGPSDEFTTSEGPAAVGVFGLTIRFGGVLAVFVLSMLLTELIGFGLSMAYWHAYPYVPWVITDAIFYLGVYLLPVLSVLKNGSDTKKAKKD